MNAISFKLTPVFAAMLIGCATAGSPETGNFSMQYTKNNPIPIGDQEGHIIYLGEAKGTAEGGSKDGSKVLNRDYVDITNGNGIHQGYASFTKGASLEIVKWSGKVNTVMNKDGTPNTTFGGKFKTVHGTGRFEDNVGKSGSYTGYFTSPTNYVVEWQIAQ
jgi:hypothetical protein